MSKILIVDDNPDDRYLMRVVLEADGHQIVEAGNGAEALELALVNPPDIVISDVLMPVMDGFALCRAWQKEPYLRQIPFVHCSANYIQPADIAFAKEIGAAAFLAKPVEPADVRQTVRTLLASEPSTGATARLRRLDDESFHMRHTAAVAEKMLEKVKELEQLNMTLAEQEHAFRHLFEANPLPMWVLDANTMAIMAVNDAMIEKYGYSRKDFLAMKSEQLRPPEERLESHATVGRIRSGPRDMTTQGVWHHELRDGRVIDVEVFAKLLEFGGRESVMALANDVTERVEARRELGRQLAMVESALHATVATVMKMGELRDPYTAGHERRVGELSEAIGRELGLDAKALRGLEIMGDLHDVGKITVPTELLTKPGKLSRVEFEMIKEHAQQGYEILRKLEFPWPVADVAWQHHERMDGSGYPRGLRGGQIMKEARILSVADVVEAMSSHRPYRPSLGASIALEEIEKNAGRLYCEEAVRACLRLFREKGFAFSS